MVSSLSYAVAAAGAVAVLSGTSEAHQTIYIPAPTFTTSDKTTKSNPIAFLENQGIKAGPSVKEYLKSKGAKTLRDFMDNKSNYKSEAAGATFEYGYTDPNGKRQPVPANGMMRSSGYTHDGPCEVWIDNKRVLGGPDSNCHTDLPGAPVSYKVDFSVCKGNCLLRWYWLGIRQIGSKWSWQVYKECVPIMSGSRSLDDGDDDDDDTVGADSDLESYDNATIPEARESRCKVKK